MAPKSAGAGTRVQWLPSGYKSYENTTAYASIVHSFVWKDTSSNYPGRWYFYIKSNKLTRQSSGSYYFLADDSAAPSTPASSGYSNS